MLAETTVAMQDSVKPFIPHLMPVFLKMMQDSDEEVRSNAVYGIGVLTEHGKDAIFEYPFAIWGLVLVE